MPKVNHTKLLFYGLVKQARADKVPLDFRSVCAELGVARATLDVWIAQLNKADVADSLLTNDDVNAIMLDKIAEEIMEDSAELTETTINPVTGAIEVVSKEGSTNGKGTWRKVTKFKDSVDGLKVLNEELQHTALALVGDIHDSLGGEDLTTRDLANLASALTSVQNAFFNKPTTNVLVAPTGGSDKLLAMFNAGNKP